MRGGGQSCLLFFFFFCIEVMRMIYINDTCHSQDEKHTVTNRSQGQTKNMEHEQQRKKKKKDRREATEEKIRAVLL